MDIACISLRPCVQKPCGGGGRKLRKDFAAPERLQNRTESTTLQLPLPNSKGSRGGILSQNTWLLCYFSDGEISVSKKYIDQNHFKTVIIKPKKNLLAKSVIFICSSTHLNLQKDTYKQRWGQGKEWSIKPRASNKYYLKPGIKKPTSQTILRTKYI